MLCRSFYSYVTHDRETLSYEDFCTFRRDLQQEILRIQISFCRAIFFMLPRGRPRSDNGRVFNVLLP